uniref:Protrudin n=1 Tax=Sinocyclocheilus anshuiensis TaxID=1608454 RepID=A0A671PJ41_9TELE
MQCTASPPQDPIQASGDQAELTQLPAKDASSTDSTSDLGSPRVLTFDLLNMVICFKRMAIFLEPITDSLEVLRYLLGWRMPLCSLFSCVLLNILFLTLSEGAWVTLLLLAVFAPAVLGYLGNRCQGTSSEMEVQKKKHFAVQRRDLQTVHMSKQEAMLEVKDMLKRIDELLTLACVYAESVYKVLYWERHAMSSMFYGSVLTAVCLLYMVPVGLSLSVLNSALFLWNRNFCRGQVKTNKLLLQPENTSRQQTDYFQSALLCPDFYFQSRLTYSVNVLPVQDQSPGNIEEAEEAEPDDEFKDAIEDDEDMSSGVPEFDTVSDNGLLSRNEPIRSKVSKLTEKLRKRVPANTTGNCFQCSSAFSVLKKRRNCSNCGVSFCSRCCSYKVLRSSMGATAPEAQRETVFVCAMCNTFLSTK